MPDDRYEPVETLLSEPGIQTSLCLDRVTGAEVVVKCVDGAMLTGEGWRRLQHDCLSLARSASSARVLVSETSYDRSTNVVRVVAPYVRGLTLAERLADDGPLELSEALAVAQSVAAALEHDHSRGVLHCAVSPSNIVIGSASQDHDATLIDIGLARSPALAGALREHLASRVLYVAPELAGLVDREVDVRADLYSLGIVLFESLVGRAPFETTLVSDMLRHHVATDPPSLRQIDVSVPRALDELVRRLLRKDPEDRCRSAAAVREELRVIADALHRGVLEPGSSTTAAPSAAVGPPAFTGRIAELATLDRCFRDAQRGVGSLVVVEAESGGGKTRLVDTFCGRAASTGAWVLRGEAGDRTAPQPLQLLSGVVEDVASATRRSTELATEVIGRVGEDAALLAQAVPALAEAFRSVPADTSRSGSAAPNQIVHALANLLDALGDTHRPAVVVLEDCQWADDLTLQVLKDWLRGPSRGDRHVMVIATIRTEQFPTDHVLRHRGAALIALAPLSPNHVTGLARSMAHDLPEEAIDVVVVHARGNPFMVSALLLGLVESGALLRQGGRWQFQSGHVLVQASRGSAAFLAGRLDLLPDGTRDVLAVGAVLGRTFDLALVAKISGLTATAARQELARAEERHLVWRDGETQFAFAHDRLRETLLGEIDPATLRELHLRAAGAIEASDSSRAFDLSFHYDAAGHDAAAFEHAREAARIARTRYDLELAARHLRIAERSATSDGAVGFPIAEELGEILMLRGEYDDADERLVRARSFAPDTVAAARIEGRLGELEFKRGNGERAEQHLAAALELLGRNLPAGTTRFGWLLARELAGRASRRALSRMRARRIIENEAGLLEAQLLTRLAYAWWFNRRTFAALWLLTHQVNVAERRSLGPERAHAKAIYGAAITAVLPMLSRRGLRYTEEARLLHIAAGSRWGEGQALAMRAAVLHAAGRFQEAVDVATAAGEILEQTGDRWELSFATWHRALCLYRLGRFDEAVDVARIVHRSGIELGAAQAEAIALEILAKAGVGMITSEMINESLDHAGTDAHAIGSATQAKACRLRSLGRLHEAIEVLEEADATLRPPAYMNVYLAPVVSWLATLHREAAEDEKVDLRGGRRDRTRRARRTARRALVSSWVYRTESPRAHREAALVAALGGSRGRARRLLRRSAREALRQGARAELALTAHAAERLGLSEITAGAGLTAAETEAASLVSEVPPESPPTLGLVERFDALLEVGSLLTSAVSQDDIAVAVADACRQLLRAERCVVAGVDGSRPEPTDDVEGAYFPEGRTLVREAIGARQPVRFKKVAFEPALRSESDANPQVRSAICAPIFVGREVVAWFVAANTQVSDFFVEEDERLAGFISRLGAAALMRERLRRELRAGIIAAQESERARIARDLHDQLGQSLTSILLGLGAAQSAARGESPGGEVLSGRLERLGEEASNALAELHRLAFELRPLVLDDLGLVAALRRLVADIEGNHGLVIEIATGDLESTGRLPVDVETTAFRVVQEALTNVVRHANAKTSSVLLAVGHGRARVVIEDDGDGFDVAEATARGFGLRNMNERAALVGGTVRVASSQTAGTTIVLEVPIA